MEDVWDLRCARNAYAGVLIGTTCGFLFGTVEGAKNAGISTDLTKIGSKLRDPVVMRFFFRQQLATTAMFGGMFTLYQTTRCMLSDTELEIPVQIGGATVVGLAPFLPNRLFRRNLPWALVLVGMDVYSGGVKSK